MTKKGHFTVYGEAAGELICAKEGKPARTDDERALRIATFIYMNMGRGADQHVAIALVKAVAKDGLEEAATICTARRQPTPPDGVPLGQEITFIKSRGKRR